MEENRIVPYYQKSLYPYSSQPSTPNGTNDHLMIKPANEDKKQGPCMMVIAAIIIVCVIILVASIVIFFAVKGSVDKDLLPAYAQSYSASSSTKFFYRHNDTISAEKVLTGMRAGSPRYCVLDTAFYENPATAFTQGHIPGARHFDLKVVNKEGTMNRFVLPHPLEFQMYVRSLGVDEECQVVLYDHGENHLSVQSATYSWWLFKLYGFNKVSILSGGFKAWKKRNFNVETGKAAGGKGGNFVARWEPEWLTVIKDIRNDAKIIDARPEHQYRGSGSHIAGSASIPSTLFINDHGALVSLAETNRILSDFNRTESGSPLFYSRKGLSQSFIVYSDTGFQASTVVFALRQAGYEARLYNGGWREYKRLGFR